MAKAFRVSFDIPEAKLATIVSLLSSEVGNLVIRDTATISGATPPPKVKFTRQRVPKVSSNTAIGIVHAAMAGKKMGEEVSYNTVKAILSSANYNPNSHTSMISQMAAHGYIERHKPQMFRIVKAFP